MTYKLTDESKAAYSHFAAEAYKKILADAFEQPAQSTAGMYMSCARVYVIISEKNHVAGIEAAAKAIGKTFQRKPHYGFRNALYIGYETASGQTYGKGLAVAAHLSVCGIPAYCDAGED